MTSLEFARAAQALAAKACQLDIGPIPAFRSPPSEPDVTRSIRRYAGGSVVAVVMKGRTAEEIVRDMTVGLLLAAGCSADDFNLDILEAAALQRIGVR